MLGLIAASLPGAAAQAQTSAAAQRNDPPLRAIGYLEGVSAVSISDIWAVGTKQAVAGDRQRVVTEHWDGHRWSQVPAPNPGNLESAFDDVEAVAADDVWAIGEQADSTGGPEGIKTLIEHWDGRSWSVIKSPNPAGTYRQLTSVSAVSATDVWAVGYYSPPDTPRQTLTLHWDGAAWKRVTSPDPSYLAYLEGVTAISTDDVWAVGSYFDPKTHDNPPMALHWDGTHWSQVDTAPPGGKKSTGFLAVGADSSSDIWATGWRRRGQGFIERSDGASWSHVQQPYDPALFGISVRTPADVWAVGNDYSTGASAIMHWDGSTWSLDDSAQPAAAGLSDVDALAADDVWAVGRYTAPDGKGHLLIEHFDGTGWHQV